VRIGIFGGTFDPPHTGHLVAAEDARIRLGLDAVRLVPARVSPFKLGEEQTPAEERVRMVRAAVEGNPHLQVGLHEMERAPPSYTVDTLMELTAAEPETDWTLLLGADQWASFGAWKDPEEIARLARIAVLTREGQDPAAMDPGVDVPWEAVPVTRIDISSSLVRERLGRGEGIRYLVPEAVRTLIEAKELYPSC
jgi:nicotinate-nucleotide adenylyltransferase